MALKDTGVSSPVALDQLDVIGGKAARRKVGTPDMLEQIVSLERQYIEGEQWDEEALRTQIDDRNKEWFVLVNNEKFTGYAVYGLADHVLHRLVIRGDEQGHGRGTFLLSGVLERMNPETVRLIPNRGSITFYTEYALNHGFLEVEVLPHPTGIMLTMRRKSRRAAGAGANFSGERDDSDGASSPVENQIPDIRQQAG